ncbi:unnamed protein product [Urochloa decumbens]|uniref:CCT domain-containing protein n=1 Tax=Urochloa decumbens TaxID=240449 RepID=A0ABC8VXY5_9POAL
MYPQHHWGHDEVVSCDAIISSRPDTLLANGGVLPPSSYMLPSLAGRPPPPADQLQATALPPMMFRRAMSTGDLIINNRDDREAAEQRVAPAPGRYSAEERRERIDKYRSKRNQRNFQKKITYACRKTLADSRPRVKGRFARNAGDGSTEADVQATATAAAPPQSESEWWPAEQEQEQEQQQDYELPDASINLLDDDEMLAAYLGVSSISLYSPSASTALPHHH